MSGASIVKYNHLGSAKKAEIAKAMRAADGDGVRLLHARGLHTSAIARALGKGHTYIGRVLSELDLAPNAAATGRPSRARKATLAVGAPAVAPPNPVVTRRKVIEALRERDRPAVRAAHERGLCIDAIARETRHGFGYVRMLLAEMGLRPNEAVRPPPREKASPKRRIVPFSEKVFDDQNAAAEKARAACLDHFRDLVAAYPGRKLASLNIPDGYAMGVTRASSGPGYGSPSALCADAGGADAYRSW